jgi:predicted nuclease of predicted toxin-antitoxin system
VKLLADENVPRRAILALREAGHDVLSVAEVAPGSPDAEVLRLSAAGGRLLLTFDKDFGELAAQRSGDVPGVLLFRLAGPPAVLTARLLAVLASETEWRGHFAVVEPGRVRLRPLP